ncbi:3-hydroxyacyl-ACP dehydratase [Vibrio breoganii]|uniref:ApeI family dehydratase n=1 Tax=Vibrio breoganii TaxID=553239 RepID=UPI000C820F38|nr:3-hydroxyacyl-ACP dehydratase [Vibrio breoganii]PMG39549.1 3-hydroxyacyl-ACP dehydratase [Vibrio breoganii]PMG82077.1 3-hydroxyacyl-ACP dehydratase [Vibrio breoganii]PMM50186.1 3-hydroxyacyl-ACP dehydratase [Vibrio breoganii]
MTKRKPTLLKKDTDANRAILVLKVDADLYDFRGHFKLYPLLPGVTQIDWAMHYGIEYLGTPSVFQGMEVIKFQEPILPNAIVTLDLSWDSTKQKLAFKYHSVQGEKNVVHSSGKMTLGN